MRKILIFSLAYVPHVGGAEIAIKEITDRISPEDFEFHMLTLRFSSTEPKEQKIGNVFVHRIGNGASYLSKMLFIPHAAAAAWLLDRKYHFHAFWGMMSYMLLPIVLSGLGKPYVLTLQEGDPFNHVFNRWFIRPLRPLLKRGFRNAAVVQAISRYLLSWAGQMGFAGEGVVVPNGVDTRRFSHDYAAEHLTRVRDTLGKKVGDIFLVTTSRLVHKNGIDTVIRALPFLSERVSFIVYGAGPDESALKALAEELGVANRVRFMGYISHEDMPVALRVCDIFVRPSRSEGMGNSFVEAMAAGIPVVATQEGGIADFLFDAKRNPEKEATGWAVDPDSSEQVTKAVEDILAYPKEAEKVVDAARRLVLSQYDWGHIAPRMQELFERAILKR